MKNNMCLAVIAVTLLSGVSVAVAANNAMSKENATKSASNLTLRDSLTLSSQQQKIAWQDISQEATKEKAPAHFAAKIGAIVPSGVMTYPVPMTVSSKVPELRRYQYALLANDRLLIVNPNDKKVADVIRH